MVTSTLLWFALLAASPPATQVEYVDVPAGRFRSTIRYEDNDGNLDVGGFAMMKHPVSNRQFQAFVQQQPQWRRDRVAGVFADSGYLTHWQAADTPGASVDIDQAVTHVSWFAADAYCKSLDARLPEWAEWEYVAAASPQHRDARTDPAWRMRLLDDGTPRAVDAAPDAAANAYGIAGLHGAAWEWVGDFSTLLSGTDKRGQDDGDRLQFCGATGLSFTNRDDYAVLKRIALLSAVQSRSTLGNLGFRCARSSP